jgi:hypothetical protein
MINIRRINCPPSLPQPICQLRLQVRGTESYGVGKDRFSDVDHCRRIASQGGVLTADCCDWANPLQLVYLISELARFLQELGGPGVTTPNSYRGKHRQRGAT